MRLTLQHICGVLAAVQCRNSGQSFRRIAKSAGRSESTIRRWCKKAGYTRNPITGLYSHNY